MKIEIDIDEDAFVPIVVPILRRSLKMLKHSKFRSDSDCEKDIKALTRSLDFYGAKP